MSFVLNDAIKTLLKSQQKQAFVNWFGKEYPGRDINIFLKDTFEHQVGVIKLFFNRVYNLDWMSGFTSYAIGYFNPYLNIQQFEDMVKRTKTPFLYECDVTFTEQDKDTRNIDINAIIKIIEHLTF